MAEVAIIASALATFFGGVNVVMRGVTLYQQYRANRARRLDARQKTGKSGGERLAHPQGMPMRSGDEHRARPNQQAPKITNGSCSQIRSFSQVAELSQQLAVRNAAPQLAVRNATPQLAHNASKASFGGVIILTPEQQARDTHKDTSKYGVSTGGRPSKSSKTLAKASAEAHWKSLKSSDHGVNTANARAVAVVNFTKSNVTMFVEKHEKYYRSYKVKSCPEIAGFVLKYRRHEVFSGETVDGKLARCNHGMTYVEDDGECDVQSSNCWRKLGVSAAGIEREVVRDPIFVQMVRGAVFGLICCVHKKPSSMNVDMRRGNGVEFVHVNTDVGGKLERGRDCCFSVFSIGSTNGWVRERVLVG